MSETESVNSQCKRGPMRMSILNTFTISRADLAKHKKGYRGFQQSNSVRKLPSLKRTVSSTKARPVWQLQCRTSSLLHCSACARVSSLASLRCLVIFAAVLLSFEKGLNQPWPLAERSNPRRSVGSILLPCTSAEAVSELNHIACLSTRQEISSARC